MYFLISSFKVYYSIQAFIPYLLSTNRIKQYLLYKICAVLHTSLYFLMQIMCYIFTSEYFRNIWNFQALLFQTKISFSNVYLSVKKATYYVREQFSYKKKEKKDEVSWVLHNQK